MIAIICLALIATACALPAPLAHNARAINRYVRSAARENPQLQHQIYKRNAVYPQSFNRHRRNEVWDVVEWEKEGWSKTEGDWERDVVRVDHPVSEEVILVEQPVEIREEIVTVVEPWRKEKIIGKDVWKRNADEGVWEHDVVRVDHPVREKVVVVEQPVEIREEIVTVVEPWRKEKIIEKDVWKRNADEGVWEHDVVRVDHPVREKVVVVEQPVEIREEIVTVVEPWRKEKIIEKDVWKRNADEGVWEHDVVRVDHPVREKVVVVEQPFEVREEIVTVVEPWIKEKIIEKEVWKRNANEGVWERDVEVVEETTVWEEVVIDQYEQVKVEEVDIEVARRKRDPQDDDESDEDDSDDSVASRHNAIYRRRRRFAYGPPTRHNSNPEQYYNNVDFDNESYQKTKDIHSRIAEEASKAE